MLETGAVQQAVTADEFKRSVHIALAETADDVLINSYLAAAQTVVENATRRLMVSRSVIFQCRPKGWARWFVPVCPVAAVTAAEHQGEDGAWSALSLTGLRLEMPADEPQLVWPDGWLDQIADGAAVRFTVTAGHGAAFPRPPQLAQAVMMVAKSWYDVGLAVAEDAAEAPQPFGARVLMRQVRYDRPSVFGCR